MKAATSRVSGLAKTCRRRADLHDLALAEHGHAVGDGHRLLLVVGDVDRRHAEGGVQALELDAGLEAKLGVEVGERLVEQEEPRLADDGAGEGDALLLAAGELAGAAGEQVVDADLAGGVLHAGGDLGLRHAVHAEREADVLLERHVRVERVVLEDHRDVALARRGEGHVGAVDEHAAGVGDLEAGDDAQRRRLAGAGRAEEGEELAGRDAEVDALQRARRCRSP